MPAGNVVSPYAILIFTGWVKTMKRTADAAVEALGG
jgi:hypothetical protein